MIITKALIFIVAAAKYRTLNPTLEERKPQMTLGYSMITLLTHFLRLQI